MHFVDKFYSEFIISISNQCKGVIAVGSITNFTLKLFVVFKTLNDK